MLCSSLLPRGVSMFCPAGTIKMNAYKNKSVWISVLYKLQYHIPYL